MNTLVPRPFVGFLLLLPAFLTGSSAAADEPAPPTKLIPLYIKVGCLTRDYAAPGAKSLDQIKASDDDGDHTDYLMLTRRERWSYDFLSVSPGDFVRRLQQAVADARKKHAAAPENKGVEVRCAVKLLVLEGHVGAGVGGSPADFEPDAHGGPKFGGLAPKQIETVQGLMAEDATIFWVACRSLRKNGTARALLNVIGRNGGLLTGFKEYCWSDASFPEQQASDDAPPAALRVEKGATAERLKELFELCGKPVAGDRTSFHDERLAEPGSLTGFLWPWLTHEVKTRIVVDGILGPPVIAGATPKGKR
jgi:hypothetical protein